MNGLRLVWQGGKVAFLTMIGWLTVYGTAFAAMPQKKEESQGGGGYVLAYMLVILGIGLGILLVCRPVRRRDRARPEHYDEKNLGKE